LGRLLLQHLEQHRGETIHGVGGLAVARREIRKRAERPVDETVGIDEDEEGPAGASGHRGRIIACTGRSSCALRSPLLGGPRHIAAECCRHWQTTGQTAGALAPGASSPIEAPAPVAIISECISVAIPVVVWAFPRWLKGFP